MTTERPVPIPISDRMYDALSKAPHAELDLSAEEVADLVRIGFDLQTQQEQPGSKTNTTVNVLDINKEEAKIALNTTITAMGTSVDFAAQAILTGNSEQLNPRGPSLKSLDFTPGKGPFTAMLLTSFGVEGQTKLFFSTLNDAAKLYSQSLMQGKNIEIGASALSFEAGKFKLQVSQPAPGTN
ncbi:hypothetical protein HYT02_05545 [Candidatus Gottesmanbacteria bacterium]|nr:hypothetical protein [Candidatus Gottesmanbacteria bacterium]